MKEPIPLKLPSNLFIKMLITSFREKLPKETKNCSIVEILDNYKALCNEEENDFEKIYQELIKDMIEFYTEDQNNNVNILLVLVKYLADSKLKAACTEAQFTQIKEILSRIKITHLQLPDFVEKNAFIEEKWISKGNYSYIHKGIYHQKKVIYKILKTKNRRVIQQQENIDNEININTIIDCSLIAKFLGVIKVLFAPILIFQNDECISLFDQFQLMDKEGKKFNDDQLFFIITNIVKAISYLHQKNIIHRDIKPENIIINMENKVIKLIDFGLAILTEEGELLTERRGSPDYLAPEIIAGLPYDYKVDIYSFAILLFEILHIITFRCHFNPEDTKSFWNKIENGTRQPIDKYVNDSFSKLIQKCWENDPDKRPSMVEIEKDLDDNKKSFFPNLTN